MEQVRGVEPPYSAWEADVLPMNYTCVFADYYSICERELQGFFSPRFRQNFAASSAKSAGFSPHGTDGACGCGCRAV